MKKIFTAVLILLCYNVIMAQDTAEYKYPYEIVVSAPRVNMPLKTIPFATSIIGREIINILPRSVAIDEPLKFIPGVKVDNQANGERVHLSIRGQGILSERGIRGIKTLLDGIPLNDPSGFTPDFYDIDWARVSRIEVLRGPAASLYGGSASGGIINILTENSPNKHLFGEFLGEGGSNNFWKGFAQFGGNVDKVNYSLSWSRALGDGYREHTHFWSNKIYGKFTYTPAPGIKLTPVIGWVDVYHENPEGINLAQYQLDPKKSNPDAIPFNEFLQTSRFTSGISGNITIEKDHVLDFYAYVKRTLFTEANNRIFNHRTLVTPGGSLQYTYNYGKVKDFFKNSFSIGGDLSLQNFDEYRVPNLNAVEGTTILSKQTVKQTGMGVFVIDKMAFGPQWNVMLSLRYDKIKNELTDLLKIPFDASGNADYDRATGRIGITYSPLPNLSIFANWGQGFLPPAIEELTQNPDNYGGFNTHLTFATSMGEEIGIRGTIKDNLFYDFAGFYMTTKDDFDRYRIPSRGQETFYKNIGESKRFGAELYLKWIPVHPLTVQLAYTYSNFKYSNTSPTKIVMDDTTIVKYIEDGKFLPNSPQHQVFFDVQWEVVPNLFVALSTEFLSKAYIDGANIETEAVESYALFHGRIVYSWKLCGISGDLSFNIKNIADQKYVAFSEPDPGGNAYQPGSGREFFGGLRIRF